MIRPSRSPSASQISEKPGFGGAAPARSPRRAGPAPAIRGGPAGNRSPLRRARKPWPVTDSKLCELQRLQALLLAVAGDGAGQRMGRKPFEREGQLRHFRFPARRKALDRFHAQFAGGQRAGLVERHDVDLRQFFHRRAAAEQNAMPRAPGDGRQHRGGNGEHQRARRGHDQQRHGVIKRAVPDVART